MSTYALTVLQGYLEMMDEQPLEGAVREKALHTMREQTQRMGRVGEAIADAVENRSRTDAFAPEKIDVPMMLRVVGARGSDSETEKTDIYL